MFDQRADPVFSEFVTEGFRVVSTVGGQREQVAGVSPGDLRADSLIGFLACCRMDIGDVQRFHVDEGGDFQCSNVVVGAGFVVTAGLVTIKPSGVDSGVPRAFLG